ncbi:hypothetical protein BURMUCGD1_3844 [Burkholderia multivorans CGD1]|nr:hypothetical protein BURMUCGD1_3844 [Burkholderia multivorans CGD1]
MPALDADQHELADVTIQIAEDAGGRIRAQLDAFHRGLVAASAGGSDAWHSKHCLCE